MSRALVFDGQWAAAMESARWRCTCRGECGVGHQARVSGSSRTARDGQCPVAGTDASPLHAVPGVGGRLVAVCDTCHQGQARERARQAAAAVSGPVDQVPVQACLFDVGVTS